MDNVTPVTINNHVDHFNFDTFLRAVKSAVTHHSKNPDNLFFVEPRTGNNQPVSLFDIYLNSFSDEGARQYHNCGTCRYFLERAGSLAKINPETGDLIPIVWDTAMMPDLGEWETVVRRLRAAVINGKIVESNWSRLYLNKRSFIGKENHIALYGSPSGGGWDHLHATITDVADKAKPEEKRLLQHVLNSYPAEVIDRAVGLFENHPGLERHSSHVYLIRELQKIRSHVFDSTLSARQKANLMWHYTAKAPNGVKYINAGVLGTFLSGLADGKSVELLVNAFISQTAPDKHLRPVAPPSLATVDQARELVAALGVEDALRYRRAATIADIQEWKWRAPAKLKTEDKEQPLFSGIKTKEQKAPKVKDVVKKTMTVAVFLRDILPKAIGMTFVPPAGNLPFIGMQTAVSPDHGRLLSYDLEHYRNTVTAYSITGDSPCSAWDISAHVPVPIEGIVRIPNLWNTDVEGADVTLLFIFAANYGKPFIENVVLFPEHIRSELHGVRSVIEAHMENTKVTTNENGLVGIAVYPGIIVEVELSDITLHVKLDRYE